MGAWFPLLVNNKQKTQVFMSLILEVLIVNFIENHGLACKMIMETGCHYNSNNNTNGAKVLWFDLAPINFVN
jgi:hypothetical protein